MALSFPLGLADFWDKLCPLSWSFHLPSATTMAETAGGEILVARRGVRLWEGEFMLPARNRNAQDQAVALLDLIAMPGASFLAYDRHRAYPQSDPTGATLGAATVTVSSVNANRRDVTLTGAPSGYVLTAGDHVSISYGSPTRYFLGRVVVGATLTGGSGTVELTPMLPDAIGNGDAVSLEKPLCKAVLVPNSFNGVMRGRTFDSAASFAWRQTLR